jgi:hypothetical protein
VNEDRANVTLSKSVELAALPPQGAEFTIEADAAARAAVAARLGVPALEHLSGAFRLTPISDGVEIRFLLEARAARECVVSLEPMTEEIREHFALRLERARGSRAVDADDEWAHEPLEGDSIDLGELLIQHLSLALDPHPRKPGARGLLQDYRDAASSPFANLKRLIDDER